MYPASKGVKFTIEVRMRILGVLCTLALFLFLIAPAPGYAQDENKSNQPQDDQKAKDNEKARENDKVRQEDKTARPDEGKRQEQPNAGRQDERQNQPEANRPQEQQQRDQQRPMDNNHRAAQNTAQDQNRNSGERGRRLPDDQFRAHFGREHRFHVDRQRIVNVSQPVVVYGGYSFQLVDAWPSDWSYDDDCYIDDVNGEYFLFDALHPGIRIAVFLIG
jgi:hypothetical protein